MVRDKYRRICQVCDKSITSRNIYRHLRTHYSIRKSFLQCSKFCTTKFTTEQVRHEHLQRLQTGSGTISTRDEFPDKHFENVFKSVPEQFPTDDPRYSNYEQLSQQHKTGKKQSSNKSNQVGLRPWGTANSVEQSSTSCHVLQDLDNDEEEPVLVNSNVEENPAYTTETTDWSFFCKFCGKKLRSRSAARMHEYTHTGEKPYRCRFCKTGFGHPTTAYRHRLVCTKRKDFQVFLTATEANKPQSQKFGSKCLQVTASKTASMKPRPEKLGRKDLQVTAMKTTSKKPRPENFGNKNRQVTVTTTAPKESRPDVLERADLQVTATKTTPKKPRPEKFPNKNLLFTVTTTVPKERRPDVLDRAYLQVTATKTVKKPQPEKSRTLDVDTCVSCKACASFQSGTGIFLTRHTGHKPYACERCGVHYSSPGRLLSHKRRCKKRVINVGSGGSRTSVGAILPKTRENIRHGSSMTTLDLSEHIRERETCGKTRYVCKICKKIFHVKNFALEHLTCHEGVEPYACEFCEKSFSEANSLKAHMERHRRPEKKLKCSKCPVRFPGVKSLAQHKIGHATKKPFLCVTCGRWFQFGYNLLEHLKRHFKG